jgi:hypothetical protein
MDHKNQYRERERILLEFLSAYDHDGMQRIFFCAGVKRMDNELDEV